MTLARLRAFHAVATRGGFTRAAEALGVSQPAISGQVRALEAHVGQALLDRRGQGVTVTPVGEQLLHRTRHLFAQMGEIEDFLATAGELERGILRIAADGPYGIMRLLSRYRSRHPGIELRLRLGNLSETLSRLTSGEADIAVATASEWPEGLESAAIDRDRIACLVPRGHPWAEATSIKLEALHQREMIMREPRSATRLLLERAMADLDLFPRIVMELGSREAVREAVAAGLGIGVVFSREQPMDDRARCVPIEGHGLEGTTVLLSTPERRRLRLVDALFTLAELERE